MENYESIQHMRNSQKQIDIKMEEFLQEVRISVHPKQPCVPSKNYYHNNKKFPSEHMPIPRLEQYIQ